MLIQLDETKEETRGPITPILNLCQPLMTIEEVKAAIWTEKVPMNPVTH